MEDGMSYSYYMLLYTACYNYCISNKHSEAMGYGAGAGPGSSGTVKGELQIPLVWWNKKRGQVIQLWPFSSVAGAHLMGSDLYNKLSEYLKGHLTKLRNVRIPYLPPLLHQC
jgi:hypothetical protein